MAVIGLTVGRLIVDCVGMHSLHDIMLEADIVYPSFQSIANNIEWSDSRRVDRGLCRDAFTKWHHAAGWHSLSIIPNHSGYNCVKYDNSPSSSCAFSELLFGDCS